MNLNYNSRKGVKIMDYKTDQQQNVHPGSSVPPDIPGAKVQINII